MAVSKQELLRSTPQLMGQIDYTKVNLSPKEAFLLSRIDGHSTVTEISKISAMSVEETMASILRLAMMDVITFREFDVTRLRAEQAPPKAGEAQPPQPKSAPAQTAPPAAQQPPPQSRARPTPPPRSSRPPAAGPRLTRPLIDRELPQEDLTDLVEKGTFREKPYPQLLGQLANDKITGILRITRRPGMGYKDIYLRSGVPVHVAGTYIIERECLGQLLKMAGKITDFDLGRSIKLVKEGKMQGEALIEIGVIDRKMLTGALKWQSELKMAEIFTWKEGEGSYEVYRVGVFAREFTPVEVSVGALILKGVKRGFPYGIVERDIDSHLDDYAIKCASSDFDPSAMKFQLPEMRLFEKVINGNTTISEIIEKSQMDPKQVKQFLYALMVTQIIEVRDKPAAGTDEDKIIDDLKKRLGLSQKGNYFDCLGIHWTSVGWKVQEGWEKIQKHYGPGSKYQKSGVPEIIDLSKEIYRLGKIAYEVLIDDRKRVEHRKSIHNETKLMTSSDLQYQQAESQILLKEDFKMAVEILESAAEIAPNNWVIQAAYGCALVKRYYPGDSQKTRMGEDIINRALRAAPKNDTVHFYAGHAYWAMRRTSTARSEFEAALRINPNNVDVKKALRAMSRGGK